MPRLRVTKPVAPPCAGAALLVLAGVAWGRMVEDKNDRRASLLERTRAAYQPKGLADGEDQGRRTAQERSRRSDRASLAGKNSFRLARDQDADGDLRGVFLPARWRPRITRCSVTPTPRRENRTRDQGLAKGTAARPEALRVCGRPRAGSSTDGPALQSGSRDRPAAGPARL